MGTINMPYNEISASKAIHLITFVEPCLVIKQCGQFACSLLQNRRNKKPLGHITHLRNSSDQKAHLWKAMIKLILKKTLFPSFIRTEWSLFVKTWLPFTEFGWNWPSDSRFVNFINVLHYFGINAFGSGELTRSSIIIL